ncbi:MAG: DUF979 domain-containing protein [Clostridium sulfidigenes]|uniref:DUF979 domain-containing protein n=1 Tax=Clostridium sulfidigenes TaxID=318464 RepID=A0A927ZNW3_9CLOT|nr:DUF979 domain-containing protein [Clostridium sulfidigenes]
MDMAALSNFLLEIFYALVGFLMISLSVYTFTNKDHKARIGTSIFWSILGIIFIAGPYIPANIVGILIIALGCLTVSKQVKMLPTKPLDGEFAKTQSEKLKNKVFLPPLVIAIVALGIAQFTSISGTAAIGIAAVIATIATLIITKANPKFILEDGARMIDSVGPVSILPQLLTALGSLFTAAGVGTVIANGISSFIPEGNLLIGVAAYCIGMAIFTMIMGNAFAAFAVITAGIGIPFVFAQGANPVVAGALALTAGYCGTLMSPMGANFNIMPAALLEIDDKNAIIKRQFPVAMTLLIAHIVLMYFLAF